MHCLSMLVFVALATSSLMEAKLSPPGGPRKLHYDVTDSFTTSERPPLTVAIWDPAEEALLKCVAANRTEIDPVARTATFVLLFPETETSPKREVLFYMKTGEDGKFTFTLAGDTTVWEGEYYYTEANCVVLGLEYKGQQCILWVDRKFKDAVPQSCIDHFVDTCGVEDPPHRRDVCFDGEGDY
ncbi:uncharacterized protein LOC144102297 [Amblyomma americanum]